MNEPHDDDFGDRFERLIRALAVGVAVVEEMLKEGGGAEGREARLAEARIALEAALSR